MTYPYTTSIYESASDISPLTPFRPAAKYRPPLEVPSGTVASRILQLQNLASYRPSRINSHLSPKIIRLDHSRTGYGRRKAARFGKPASRSSRLDESDTSQFNDTTHSFLTLRSYRASHMEEHALTDGLTKWERSSGINGQLQPQGMGARVQYEATSPAGILPRVKLQSEGRSPGPPQSNSRYQDEGIGTEMILPKSKSFEGTQDLLRQKWTETTLPSKGAINRTQIANRQNEMETLRVSRSVSILNAAVAPSSPAGYYLDYVSPIREAISPPWLPRKKMLASAKGIRLSERSTGDSTLSTRKQSVKDLYRLYGIERPAGLVSESDDASRCVQPQPPAEERPRHMSPLLRSKDNPRQRREVVSDSHLEHRQDKPAPKSNTFKHTIALPRSAAGQTSQAEPSDLKKSPRQTSQNPTFHSKVAAKLEYLPPLSSKQTALHRGSRKSPPNYIEMPPRKHDRRSIAHARRVLKQFNILGNERPSTLNTVRLSPVTAPINGCNPQDEKFHHYDFSQDIGHRYSTFSFDSEEPTESDKYCDSPGCRATHSGHKPYRHSISCTRRRQSTSGQSELRYSDEDEASHYHGQKPNTWKCKRKDRHKAKLNHGNGLQSEGMPARTANNATQREAFPKILKSKQMRHHNRLDNSRPMPFNDLPTVSTDSRGPEVQQSPVTVIIQPPTRHETLASQEAKPMKNTVIGAERSSREETRRQSGPKSKCKSVSGKSRHKKKDFGRVETPPAFAELMSSRPTFGERDIDVAYFTNSNPKHVDLLHRPSTIDPEAISPTSRSPSHGKPTTAISNDNINKHPSGRSSVLSRRISTFFKIQPKHSIPHLKKHLQEHQEDLRRIENAGHTPATPLRKGEVRAQTPDLEQRMRLWRLKLTGRHPRREDVNDAPVSQHELRDDELVRLGSKETPEHDIVDCGRKAVMADEQFDDRARGKMAEEGMDHDCAWKLIALKKAAIAKSRGGSITLDSGGGDVEILGVSVVIHLEGREDMVLKAELWNGN